MRCPFLILLNVVQVLTQVGVAVGHRVSEQHDVIVVLKSVRKSQREVTLRMGVLWVLFHLVLKVLYIFASSMPADLFVLRLLLTVHAHLHSEVKHAVWLGVIHDVELNSVAFLGVHDPEVKPLGVPAGVYVVLH
jgi:hypothetical protein